jgi:hypothetical protein
VVKETEWRPWGFDDYESVPNISDEALSAAMEILKVSGDSHRADLRERFHQVAITYWRAKRDVEIPGPAWHRQQIKPIQKATTKLLSLLRAPKSSARAGLMHLTKLRMNRDLRSSADPESIEQLLARFKSVCDELLRPKGSAGARTQSHVEKAVRDLITVWRQVTRTPLSLSLDTEIGPSKRQQFAYPGPFFVQTILQAIDHELSTAEIATALRKVLGRGRVQKSKGKCS